MLGFFFSVILLCFFFHSKDAISVGSIYVPAQLKVILDLNLHFKIHVDCYDKKYSSFVVLFLKEAKS